MRPSASTTTASIPDSRATSSMPRSTPITNTVVESASVSVASGPRTVALRTAGTERPVRAEDVVVADAVCLEVALVVAGGGDGLVGEREARDHAPFGTRVADADHPRLAAPSPSRRVSPPALTRACGRRARAAARPSGRTRSPWRCHRDRCAPPGAGSEWCGLPVDLHLPIIDAGQAGGDRGIGRSLVGAVVVEMADAVVADVEGPAGQRDISRPRSTTVTMSASTSTGRSCAWAFTRESWLSGL